MLRLLRSLRLDREEGQVLPMFAAGLLAMLLMTGVVIDGGNLFQNKQSVQNAADAAALAAATAISNGSCGSCGTYAGTYAGYNGVSGTDGNVTSPTAAALPACTGAFSDTTPPTTVPGCYVYPYNGDSSRIEVWLTRRTSNFFGGLLGIGTSSESARAVALVTSSGSNSGPGTYIYSSGDVTLKGSGTIQEPVIAQGNLNINGNNNLDAIARLVAVGLSGTGTVNNTGGATIGNGPAATTLKNLLNAVNNAMTVFSTAGLQSPGTVFVHPAAASCTVSLPTPPCEWIEYGGTSATQLTGLTRGYGGNSTPAAHAVGEVVDPRLADFWAPSGCAAFCGTRVITVHTGVYQFTPPTFDITTAFGDAALGPNKPCGRSTGTVPSFGNGSQPTNPGGTTDLAPTGNSGYICVALDAGNNIIGEIAWGGSQAKSLVLPNGTETVWPGELKVIGTIFLNANLKFGSDVIYQAGRGGTSTSASIWTTGGLSISTLRANCGSVVVPSACGTTTSPWWNPNLDLLGIVAHQVNASSNNDISFNGGKQIFQGALYTDGTFNLGGNETFQGLLDAASVTINGGNAAPSPTITGLPPDFPGASSISLVE